jgi:hypothetical protein
VVEQTAYDRILVGQPLLAVLRGLAKIARDSKDSQEWLSQDSDVFGRP